MLTAIAHPLRLQIIAELAGGRVHVSGLARRLGMSRPLLYMHLDRLEKAGLVTGQLELSDDGKAMKYFELVPFEMRITAETVVRALAERRQGCAPHGGERPMTHTTTLASAGTNYTAIGVLLAILVPICAAVAVIVWNYYRLQRHRADAVALASYRKLAEEAVSNMTDLRADMAKLAEHVSAVEQLMRDVG